MRGVDGRGEKINEKTKKKNKIIANKECPVKQVHIYHYYFHVHSFSYMPRARIVQQLRRRPVYIYILGTYNII